MENSNDNEIKENKFFKREFTCKNISEFAEKRGRDINLMENSDKIILPSASLEHLSHFSNWYPYTFSIQASNKPSANRIVYAGVMEFTAEDHIVYVPKWIMNTLGLNQDDRVLLVNVLLPKGNYIKLLPLDSTFLKLKNPKVVLEYHLKNYTTLTKNEIIPINYLNRDFKFKITSTLPSDAICIVDTEIKFEFEVPNLNPGFMNSEDNKINQLPRKSSSPIPVPLVRTPSKPNISNKPNSDYWSNIGQGKNLN